MAGDRAGSQKASGMHTAPWTRRLTIAAIGLLALLLLNPVAARAGGTTSKKKGPRPTTVVVSPTTTTTSTTSTTVPTGQTVRVSDYGTTTAAVQRAADAARGAILSFASGVVYEITAPIRLPSDVTVVGNGATLRTPAGTTSSTTSDGILDIVGVTNVEVSGLTLDGNRARQSTWSQWRHAIRVLDSSQVRIHDNQLVNLIGDGVYVSHRPDAVPPFRCSASVEIARNTFRAEHDNRNGVSLVCGSKVAVRDNSLYRMARPDMPGSIDLEPNRAEDFLEDIEISGNQIDSGDGTFTPSGIVYIDTGSNARVAGVSVHHNVIRGSQLKYGVAFYGQYERSRVSGVTIWSNDIRNIRYSSTAAGITVEQGVPATVSGNVIDGVTGWGVFSYRSCVSVRDNQVGSVTLDPVKQLEPTC